jgi:hypothetical protein
MRAKITVSTVEKTLGIVQMANETSITGATRRLIVGWLGEGASADMLLQLMVGATCPQCCVPEAGPSGDRERSHSRASRSFGTRRVRFMPFGEHDARTMADMRTRIGLSIVRARVHAVLTVRRGIVSRASSGIDGMDVGRAVHDTLWKLGSRSRKTRVVVGLGEPWCRVQIVARLHVPTGLRASGHGFPDAVARDHDGTSDLVTARVRRGAGVLTVCASFDRCALNAIAEAIRGAGCTLAYVTPAGESSGTRDDRAHLVDAAARPPAADLRWQPTRLEPSGTPRILVLLVMAVAAFASVAAAIDVCVRVLRSR